MPVLHLLRHAKSSWDVAGLDDHDRALTARGRTAAAAMGGYLRRAGIAPDGVLCSTAHRAVETLEAIRGGLPDQTAVAITRDLYEVDAGRLRDQLRATDPAVTALLVIGHNPGMEDLAVRLAGEGGELEALRRMAGKFPTGALASLTFQGAWADLADGAATLVGFVTPTDLA